MGAVGSSGRKSAGGRRAAASRSVAQARPARSARTRRAAPLGEEEVSRRLQKELAEQAAALRKAYTRLRVSDRMASIGALAAGLGHDMNNVLLPVRAHLDAARRLSKAPEVRGHIEAVQKTVMYLQQLADGLHFLASDAGDDAERGSTSLSAWWSQVGPLLTKAVPKHVKVSVALAEDLPEVAIPGHALTQAVLNLVVNAGQAIPADRTQPAGRVTIAAQPVDGGRAVQLDVVDNGVGMSAQTQRNAFEMFYTTKTRGMGTGLGLPLVASVVRRVGGDVQIESRLGKGTTVRLRLPTTQPASDVGPRRCALVTIADGRAARMVQHLLEAKGVRTCRDGDPDDADLWLLDPTGQNLRQAKAWIKARPGRRLLLFGKPGGRIPRGWEALDPIVIDAGGGLGALRAALDLAAPEGAKGT